MHQGRLWLKRRLLLLLLLLLWLLRTRPPMLTRLLLLHERHLRLQWCLLVHQGLLHHDRLVDRL